MTGHVGPPNDGLVFGRRCRTASTTAPDGSRGLPVEPSNCTDGNHRRVGPPTGSRQLSTPGASGEFSTGRGDRERIHQLNSADSYFRQMFSCRGLDRRRLCGCLFALIPEWAVAIVKIHKPPASQALRGWRAERGDRGRRGDDHSRCRRAARRRTAYASRSGSRSARVGAPWRCAGSRPGRSSRARRTEGVTGRRPQRI